MKKIFTIAVFSLSPLFIIAQTLFVPSGTGGIGTSTNSHVGIGTSTPYNIQGWDKTLDVAGAGHSKIIATSSSSTFRVGLYSHSTWHGGGGFVGTESNHKLHFISNYDPKMTLDVNGNFGVGNTSPEARFTISQVGNGWNDGLRINRDASNYLTLTEDVTDIRLKNWGTGGILFFTSTSQPLTILNGGNVGIGTASPGVKLVVNGLGGGNTDLAVNGRIVTGDASNAGGVWVAGAGNMFMGQVSTTAMGWYNNGAWRMIADNNGNVGIGTLSPTQKLTVNGTIYGKEVKVDLSVPGPDYVFEEGYKLTSLEDIETYIDQNKHLSEVPSAKEMERDGIQLGEMNMLLLKKIEELTLHMIELKKENNLLKDRMLIIENKK